MRIGAWEEGTSGGIFPEKQELSTAIDVNQFIYKVTNPFLFLKIQGRVMCGHEKAFNNMVGRCCICHVAQIKWNFLLYYQQTFSTTTHATQKILLQLL